MNPHYKTHLQNNIKTDITCKTLKLFSNNSQTYILLQKVKIIYPAAFGGGVYNAFFIKSQEINTENLLQNNKFIFWSVFTVYRIIIS